MKKTEIIKGLAVLLAVTILSGYLLARVFKITKPLIAEQKRIEEERLNREIFPDGSGFVDTEEKGIPCVEVFDAEKNRMGMIFQIIQQGYGGAVVIKVGMDNEMNVRGVRILEHKETPGLGSKIEADSFLSQFKGKSGSALYLSKENPEGKIDAITGATISSRAVSEGIIKLQERLKHDSSPESQ